VISVPLNALIDIAALLELSPGLAYLTLGLSTIITQELAALLGGFAADQGHLHLPIVVLVVATAVFLESVALYAVGRWRAAWVRLKLRNSPPVVKKLLRAMRWSPWRSTMISRFAFGARIALPLACGAARVPVWIFLTGTAAAAIVWAIVFAGLGWALGEGAVLLVGEVKKYEGVIALLVVALGAAAWWWLWRRQKKAIAKEGAQGAD
jgi:membrane protein DedA with SNARE-associated domain